MPGLEAAALTMVMGLEVHSPLLSQDQTAQEQLRSQTQILDQLC